jgi:hypothetical protein
VVAVVASAVSECECVVNDAMCLSIGGGGGGFNITTVHGTGGGGGGSGVVPGQLLRVRRVLCEQCVCVRSVRLGDGGVVGLFQHARDVGRPWFRHVLR